MIEQVIEAKTASIGSMDVKRVLPFRKRRSVGPFVFVDEFGPIDTVTDTSLDVLPHPHIGLSTVTYLFSGKMMHRDSLGTVQRIEPGQVNLMNAASGIVHSERVSDARNATGSTLAGLQTWLAIPEADEDGEPSFEHSGELPSFQPEKGVNGRLILGSIGELSSVTTPLRAFYAEYQIKAGASFEVDARHEERAVYVVRGSAEILGVRYSEGTLPVIAEGATVTVRSNENSVVMVLGGPALEKPRKMFWNFVATDKDRITEAAERWRNHGFPEIPDETGYIPLPDFPVL